MKKILSIDGGGIRGIIPGQILVALEKKLQIESGDEHARIAEYFDFFAGSSTGGILICLLLCPDKDNPQKPRFSAQEAVDLYSRYGHEIFDVSLWNKIVNYEAVFDEKYSEKPLERILNQYFGDLKLSQLLKPCIITAYNIEERKAHFFAQHDFKRKGDGGDFFVKDICRATSAAPTYFETALIKSISGVQYPLIDGGVFANNPSLCAYAEVRNAKDEPIAENMFVVSIGTGSENISYDYQKAKDWGAVGWIKPVIDIMMSGAAEVTDYHMKKMFSANGNQANYIRIQPASLRKADPALDNASLENIEALIEVGIKTSEDCQLELERIISVLKEGSDRVEF
jgi:patatin-like phospholipase/acyl hydrolase